MDTLSGVRKGEVERLDLAHSFKCDLATGYAELSHALLHALWRGACDMPNVKDHNGVVLHGEVNSIGVLPRRQNPHSWVLAFGAKQRPSR